MKLRGDGGTIFRTSSDDVTDNDILIDDLKRIYREMQEGQTPIEPEFAAALYSSRAELYRLF